MEDGALINCGLCQKTKAKYRCPKCCVLYCSLQCYRSLSHNNCSEQFYQGCIKEELQSQACERVPTQKIGDIIKHEKEQMQEENLNCDDSDDDEDVELGDRLKNVNLDDPEALWERLNDKEKLGFLSALKSGEVFDYLPDK